MHPLTKLAPLPMPPPQENNYYHSPNANVILASFSVPTFNKSPICQDCLCNISSSLTLPTCRVYSHHLSSALHKAPYKGSLFWDGHSFSIQVPGWPSLHSNVVTSLSFLSATSLGLSVHPAKPRGCQPLSPTQPSSSPSDHLHPAPSTSGPFVRGSLESGCSPPSLPFSRPAPTHPSGPDIQWALNIY